MIKKPLLYKQYEILKINQKQLKSFINTLNSQLLCKIKNKKESIAEVHSLLSLLKLSSTTENSSIYLINKFIKQAALRFSLREYVARGKKTLLPKPINKERARLRFIKNLLKDLEARPEDTFSAKVVAEIDDFNNKRGSLYHKKMESYVIAKQNVRQGLFVYKRSKIKINADKKNKLTYF